MCSFIGKKTPTLRRCDAMPRSLQVDISCLRPLISDSLIEYATAAEAFVGSEPPKSGATGGYLGVVGGCERRRRERREYQCERVPPKQRGRERPRPAGPRLATRSYVCQAPKTSPAEILLNRKTGPQSNRSLAVVEGQVVLRSHGWGWVRTFMGAWSTLRPRWRRRLKNGRGRETDRQTHTHASHTH